MKVRREIVYVYAVCALIGAACTLWALWYGSENNDTNVRQGVWSTAPNQKDFGGKSNF